jgi:hypothetical protein
VSATKVGQEHGPDHPISGTSGAILRFSVWPQGPAGPPSPSDPSNDFHGGHAKPAGSLRGPFALQGAAFDGECENAGLSFFILACPPHRNGRSFYAFSVQKKECTMATQIVMDATGDTRHEFDPADAAAVAEAENRFRELTGAGFTAAVRNAEGRSELIRGFDPSAKETLFFPRLQGG